jgi:hypothetical protein
VTKVARRLHHVVVEVGAERLRFPAGLAVDATHDGRIDARPAPCRDAAVTNGGIAEGVNVGAVTLGVIATMKRMKWVVSTERASGLDVTRRPTISR